MEAEVKTMIRMPQEVRDWFRNYAKESNRSMNGQINAILRDVMAQERVQSKRNRAAGAEA